jgi:PAS domain-containing protein
MAVRHANPDTRFVYLTRLVDSKVKFLVESEPDDSKDHSPIGSVYDSASPEFLGVFQEGQPTTEGPLPDEFGVWVTGFAPITDPATGQVAAVLGMDLAAGDWARQIYLGRLGPIGVTCLVSLMLIGFSVAAKRIRESAEHILDSEQIYRSLVEGSPSSIAMFDSHGRYLSLNSSGLDAMGWNESDMIGKPFTDVWPENDRPAVADAVGRGANLDAVRPDCHLVRFGPGDARVAPDADRRRGAGAGGHARAHAVLREIPCELPEGQGVGRHCARERHRLRHAKDAGRRCTTFHRNQKVGSGH